MSDSPPSIDNPEIAQKGELELLGLKNITLKQSTKTPSIASEDLTSAKDYSLLKIMAKRASDFRTARTHDKSPSN